MWRIQVLFLELSGFFFSDPWSVESSNVESSDIEGQLYLYFEKLYKYTKHDKYKNKNKTETRKVKTEYIDTHLCFNY